MKLLDILKKRDGEDTGEKERRAVDLKELEIYSGMRVMVETPEGQMLFIADLQDPCGGTAKLCQCSHKEAAPNEGINVTEHMHVNLRGYNNRKRKAVFMEGMITPEQKHIWQIEGLTVTRIENERTFNRLNTDIDGVITGTEGGAAKEIRCKLLNISAGGASFSSEYRYHKGDRFLLKVRLLEHESEMVLYCEVLRMAEKSESSFEYGCRFLELEKAEREQIIQSISAIRNNHEKK